MRDHMRDNRRSTSIGPHNGRELQLMLSGEKPMAAFYAEPGVADEDVGDADFKPHVDAGTILKFVFDDPVLKGQRRCYCLPTEEWRCKLSNMLFALARERRLQNELTTDDLHRIDGTLLGYAKADIEYFIRRAKMNSC